MIQKIGGIVAAVGAEGLEPPALRGTFVDLPGRHPVPRRAGARRRGSGDVPRSRREDPRRGPPADQDGHIGRRTGTSADKRRFALGFLGMAKLATLVYAIHGVIIIAATTVESDSGRYSSYDEHPLRRLGHRCGRRHPCLGRRRTFGVRPSPLRVRPRWRRAADPTWSGAFGRVSSGRRRARRGRCRWSAWIGLLAPCRPSQLTSRSWSPTRRRTQPWLAGVVGTLSAPWMAWPRSKYSGLYMFPFSGLSTATGNCVLLCQPPLFAAGS